VSRRRDLRHFLGLGSQDEVLSADHQQTETVMNIRNVGKSGNVERTEERRSRPAARRDVLTPQPPRDEARISDTSRETAASVENLAERARQVPADRRQVVADAVEKLNKGELDGEAAAAGAARRLLGGNFLSI
jgi:hypothetical protein